MAINESSVRPIIYSRRPLTQEWGIGFGLQNLTSNFIAGLMLLFEQHIKVGDRITVGDTEGDVTEINIRSTTIRSLNNVAIVVPNSEFISSTVTNWS
ncbi:MAG: mechanosensitive ion channel, partial [Nitrospirales bacterium]